MLYTVSLYSKKVNRKFVLVGETAHANPTESATALSDKLKHTYKVDLF